MPKPRWMVRKTAYLAHLRRAVPRCGWLPLPTNCTMPAAPCAIINDTGDEVWSRFSTGRDEQLWWYDELVAVLGETDTAPQLVAELRDVVAVLIDERTVPVMPCVRQLGS